MPVLLGGVGATPQAALAQSARSANVAAGYRITDAQIDAIAAAVKAKTPHDQDKEFQEAGGPNTPHFRNDYTVAQPMLLKLALAGSVGGAFYLGSVYDRGFDIVQGYQILGHVDPDYPKAVRLYRIAAETGSPPALLRMSEMYSMGRGVPKDAKLAEEWMTRYRNTPYFKSLRPAPR